MESEGRGMKDEKKIENRCIIDSEVILEKGTESLLKNVTNPSNFFRMEKGRWGKKECRDIYF